MRKIKTAVKKVCEVVDQKKAEDITLLDVSGICSFADWMIICHGYNEKQNQAICDEIMARLKKEERLRPHHLEGYQNAEWILMDYLDFVIHIFSPTAREFYRLEKLWSDGIRVEPEALSA